MNRTIFALLIIAAIALRSRSFAQQASPAVTTTAEQKGDEAKPRKLYKLAPNDVVLLKVYQEDDLQTQARVGSDGIVTLPLLGPVKIGGKTIEEATTMITALFDDGYLVNPQVSITIVEYAKRHFTVLGQVQRPGTYDMPGEDNINLLQAISMAGGYTRIGAPWKITLQRTVDDEQRVFKLDADAMSKDKNAKPFEILPDDTITVGEKII